MFFLAVMAVAGYYVFMRAVAGGDYVTVPAIVGMPFAEAYTTLLDSGLAVGEVRERFNQSVPKSHVISQRPQAGKVVRKGRKVYPTVSMGADLAEVPDLIGQTQTEAEATLARTGQFSVRQPVSHMPHATAPDIVIGQDPPAGKPVAIGATIALLVSSGVGGSGFLMPDLVTMPQDDAVRTLERMGLKPIPILVDAPDAPMDVVLEQTPPPGTTVRADDEVSFKVRSSKPVEDAWREIRIRYVTPESWAERRVRFDVINKDGVSWTLFPQPKDYEAGQPPRYPGGTPFTIPLRFRDQVTVEVYLDGVRVQSYYYEGDADPVVTRYAAPPEGTPSG